MSSSIAILIFKLRLARDFATTIHDYLIELECLDVYPNK